MNKDKILFFLKENITYILICVSLFIVCIPHYNLNGDYALIGMYYTPKSAEKKRNEEDLIQITQKNTDELKLTLIESSSKYKKLEEKYNEIEEEKNKLAEQVEVLTNKLEQQTNFYTNNKENKEKVKKVSFANVSKKQVRNDRPEFGNSFSKAIKKSKN